MGLLDETKTLKPVEPVHEYSFEIGQKVRHKLGVEMTIDEIDLEEQECFCTVIAKPHSDEIFDHVTCSFYELESIDEE